MTLRVPGREKSGNWKEIERMENFDEPSVIKIRGGVKKILDNLKIHKRETYDDAISRLIAEHSSRHKDIPLEILKNIDARIEEVNQGKVYSAAEAKKRVFDDKEDGEDN